MPTAGIGSLTCPGARKLAITRRAAQNPARPAGAGRLSATKALRPATGRRRSLPGGPAAARFCRHGYRQAIDSAARCLARGGAAALSAERGGCCRLDSQAQGRRPGVLLPGHAGHRGAAPALSWPVRAGRDILVRSPRPGFPKGPCRGSRQDLPAAVARAARPRWPRGRRACRCSPIRCRTNRRPSPGCPPPGSGRSRRRTRPGRR